MIVSAVRRVRWLTVTLCTVVVMSARPALAEPPETGDVAPVVPRVEEAELAESSFAAEHGTASASHSSWVRSSSAAEAWHEERAVPWSPPPDPLLSDEEVPEWPESRAQPSSGILEPDRVASSRTAAALASAEGEEERFEAQRARSWVRAGIVGVVAGAALIAGGVAMRLSDPCAFVAGNNCFVDARNRAAAAMGIPGGLMLGAGIAMIITGETQLKRLRLGPTMSRTFAGASMNLRF